MTSLDVLALHLLATKASAEALARQCAVLLAELRMAPAPTAASAVAPTVSASEAPDAPEGPCPHPPQDRYPCGRMGAPKAFLCRACGEEVLQP